MMINLVLLLWQMNQEKLDLEQVCMYKTIYTLMSLNTWLHSNETKYIPTLKWGQLHWVGGIKKSDILKEDLVSEHILKFYVKEAVEGPNQY